MNTKNNNQISSSATQPGAALTLSGPPGVSLTTGQALRRVVEASTGQISRAALARYQFCAARISAALGPCLIHLVTDEQFAGFLATLCHRNGNPVSPSTKNYYVALFHMAMRAAGGAGALPHFLPVAEAGFAHYTNNEIKGMIAAVRREERGFLLCLTHLAIRECEAAMLVPGCIDVAAQRCTLQDRFVIEGNRLGKMRRLIPGVPMAVWEGFAAFPLERLQRPWGAVRHDLKCAVGRTVSSHRLRITAAANYAALYGSKAAARICRCSRVSLRPMVAHGPTEAEALEYFDLATFLKPAA